MNGSKNAIETKTAKAQNKPNKNQNYNQNFEQETKLLFLVF
jgi:hypothetical protein